MVKDSRNNSKNFDGDSLVEAVRALGGVGSNQSLDGLRDCFSQLGTILRPKEPPIEQPKDPRRRLCPLVYCCKCHKTNVTLYIYGDKRICKKCRKEMKT